MRGSKQLHWVIPSRGERQLRTSWSTNAPWVLLLLGLGTAATGCGPAQGSWTVTSLRLVDGSADGAVVSVGLGREVIVGSETTPGEIEEVNSCGFGDCQTEQRQAPPTVEYIYGLRERLALLLELDIRHAEVHVLETPEPRSGEVRDVTEQAWLNARAGCAAGQPLVVVVSEEGDGIELRRCSADPVPADRRPLPGPAIYLDGEILQSLHDASQS